MKPQDFFDPDVVECPFSFYQAVRNTDPVLEIVEPDSQQTFYLVTP